MIAGIGRHVSVGRAQLRNVVIDVLGRMFFCDGNRVLIEICVELLLISANYWTISEYFLFDIISPICCRDQLERDDKYSSSQFVYCYKSV